jgi:hypothetical protein
LATRNATWPYGVPVGHTERHFAAGELSSAGGRPNDSVSVQGDRWAAYGRGARPAGGRRLAAVAIVLATAGPVGWALTHASGACACGPAIHFGLHQPGFHRLAGSPARAVRRLPGSVTLAPDLGRPKGVFKGGGAGLVLYGPRSRFGVFRFTAGPLPSGFDAGTIRALASACEPCSDNRLVLLAPGVRGALLAGGNGPNSVTWIEHGLSMMVLGPAAGFDATRALAAARALAVANGRWGRVRNAVANRPSR